MEVSELGLPADQRVWVGHGKPELKAHHSKLREGTVAHGVLGLVLTYVLQRSMREGEEGRKGGGEREGRGRGGGGEGGR